MSVSRSIIRSLCPTVTLTFSFATADSKRPLRHAFIVLRALHLLHSIAVPMVNAKLHRSKANGVTSHVSCVRTLHLLHWNTVSLIEAKLHRHMERTNI